MFDDGERTVQVTVEPTFMEVFAQVVPALHAVIDSLDLRRVHDG